MTLRERLIAVYASIPVAQIRSSADYQALCQESGSESVFQAERDQIETTKALIEEYLKPPLTPAEETREALDLLVGTRREKDQSLFHALISAGYKPHWSAAQQQYFDYAWSKIQVEYDFFLSFTTRYPEVPGENPVNLDYQWFIIHVLGKDEFDKADRRKTNLLAQALYRLLKQPPLEGFYYPDSEFDNARTVAKLESAIANSLVFVQLVQNVMFVRPSSGENYCFNEFQRAMEALKGEPNEGKRLLFAVAEKDREALIQLGSLVPLVYRNWHRKILEKNPPYLAQVDFPNDARIKELKMLVDEKLSPPIMAALNRIVDGVPE